MQSLNMTSKLLTFLLLAIGLSSCEKIDVGRIENLNGGIIHVIGHGGAGFQSAFNELPENSMSSIERAIEVYNAEGVEIDIQLTKDEQLVAYHDNKLETSTDGFGYIYQNTLAELKNVHYNNEFYATLFLKESIISLEEVLLYFSSRRIKPQLHLDLRTWLFDSEKYTEDEFLKVYVEKIIDVVTKYNYQSNTYIGSSSKKALKYSFEIDSSIRLMYETENISEELNYLTANNIHGIIAYNDRISIGAIQLAQHNNIRVLLFNVKSQNSIVEAVNKHPEYIITDNIPKLQQVLY